MLTCLYRLYWLLERKEKKKLLIGKAMEIYSANFLKPIKESIIVERYITHHEI